MDKKSQERISRSIRVINSRTKQVIEQFSGIPTDIVMKIFLLGVETGQLASNEAYGEDF